MVYIVLHLIPALGQSTTLTHWAFILVKKRANWDFFTEIKAYIQSWDPREPIGPMHEETILGNTSNNTHCLVLVLFSKVGIPLVKINICQRFKYVEKY